jgi:CheY-like chemotaxis protein
MARILIVDDQNSVLLTLEALLTKHMHSVVACKNATDAFQTFLDEPFDLVITDAVMPGRGDGYFLTQAIRRHPKLGKTPVMLLTGKREKSDIQRGIEVGVNDYVVKPLDPELLIAKIEKILATKSPESQQFAKASVNFTAEISSKTEVVLISELGLQLNSNIPLPVGKIWRLNSQLFAEIGIDPPPVRVDSCEKLKNQDGFYKIEAHFVGATEKELAPIRLWIRSKKSFK